MFALAFVVLSRLPIQGDLACPSVEAIDAALAGLRPGDVPIAAHVEVLRSGHTVELGLYDREGGLHVARSVLVREQTCSELAATVAAIVHEWEQLPVPEPDPARQTESAARFAEAIALPALPEPEPLADEQIGRGVRLIGATVGAALGVTVPAGAALALGGKEPRVDMLLYSTLVFGPPLIAALAFAGHRLAGGKGNYGFAMLGVVLGCASAFAAMVVPEFSWGAQPGPQRLVTAAVLAVGVTVLMLEVSDARERAELRVGASPLRDGAAVSLGGSF